jgi:hypothetical protein
MATAPSAAKPKAKPAAKPASKTANKPANRPAGGAKTGAAAEAKAARVAKASKDGSMRTLELVDAIAPNITVSRKDIRAALDAAFKVMGEALAEGKMLNLPPLGKMSVKRTKTGDKSDIVMLKLRRAKAGVKVPGQGKTKAEAANETLADDDE